MALEPQRALRMGNSFEEALGARRSSFIGLRARLRGAGLVQPHLTGSGSAVFGLLEPRASVGKALERLRGDEVIYLVHSARRALEIRRLS